MPRFVLLELVRQRRTWPDEGHLPTQDVDELRQFVQACLAEHATDAGNPRVVRQFEQRLVVVAVPLSARFDEPAYVVAMKCVIRVGEHRSELQYREELCPSPHADLTVEDRTWRREFHERRDNEQRRREYEQQRQARSEERRV